MRIGLIADTHGYLGEEAIAALRGCERIVHAGDIGPGVLGRLAEIALVTAVRGNNDTSGAESELPATVIADFGGVRLAVVHRLVDAPPLPWEMLIFGHSHRRHLEWRGGRLLVNPGAAGRRGFHRERSVALLELEPARQPAVEFIDLGPRSAANAPGRTSNPAASLAD